MFSPISVPTMRYSYFPRRKRTGLHPWVRCCNQEEPAARGEFTFLYYFLSKLIVVTSPISISTCVHICLFFVYKQITNDNRTQSRRHVLTGFIISRIFFHLTTSFVQHTVIERVLYVPPDDLVHKLCNTVEHQNVRSIRQVFYWRFVLVISNSGLVKKQKSVKKTIAD